MISDPHNPIKGSTDSSGELRQEYRLEERETVYIEQGNNIVITQTLDMSANGLRVISDIELPTGSIVRTCVQLKNTHERFMLVSEVKWSQLHQQPGEFLLGLSLFESDDTDIQAWKEMIARRCSE